MRTRSSLVALHRESDGVDTRRDSRPLLDRILFVVQVFFHFFMYSLSQSVVVRSKFDERDKKDETEYCGQGQISVAHKLILSFLPSDEFELGEFLDQICVVEAGDELADIVSHIPVGWLFIIDGQLVGAHVELGRNRRLMLRIRGPVLLEE